MDVMPPASEKRKRQRVNFDHPLRECKKEGECDVGGWVWGGE